MRAVLQRVLSSQVTVDGQVVGSIGPGWLILLGVGQGDTPEITRFVADKCANLRAFSDADGKMNLSVQDIKGSILVVSQFTLYGDCSRGRRPSFEQAAAPAIAKTLYELFCEHIQSLGIPVQRGIFQADMKVSLINDGPVTLIVEKTL